LIFPKKKIDEFDIVIAIVFVLVKNEKKYEMVVECRRSHPRNPETNQKPCQLFSAALGR